MPAETKIALEAHASKLCAVASSKYAIQSHKEIPSYRWQPVCWVEMNWGMDGGCQASEFSLNKLRSKWSS